MAGRALRGHIFLIGMPCCGKTTLGSAVAAAFGVPFCDLDQAIEQRRGASVSEIFAMHGEDEFRRLETEELRRVAAMPGPMIVACGGGTPCREGNLELMADAGTVVFLQASLERLLERLMLYGATRPLVAGKTPEQIATYLEDTLAKRRPFYERAQAVFSGEYLDTASQLEQAVASFGHQFLNINKLS